MSDESTFTNCKIIVPTAPPPVGTVVEYENVTWRVRDGGQPYLMRFEDEAKQGCARVVMSPDWSRVTVVPVPEGWEVVATKEEATRAGDGSLMCMYSLGAGSRWRFADRGFFPGGDLRYIWLRRKPAEQQFKPTDKQREFIQTDGPALFMGMSGTRSTQAAMSRELIARFRERHGRTCTRCGEVNAIDAETGKCVACKPEQPRACRDCARTGADACERCAERPAPVDVPVGSRWRNGENECTVLGMADIAGERFVKFRWNDGGTSRRTVPHFLTRYTRLPDPAPEQFVPRVATWSDVKVGAVMKYQDETPETVTKRGDGMCCDECWRTDTECHVIRSVVNGGEWTLIRPAPEVQAFDPKALRAGDAVAWSGGRGSPLIVDRLDGSNVWWEGGGVGHMSAITAYATRINGVPVAEWVATVQPARLAAADFRPDPVPSLTIVDEAAPLTYDQIRALTAPRPTCAACSKPIVGRPLELDEGEVKLCPGDACVNAYARGLRPRVYDPDAEREACRDERLPRDAAADLLAYNRAAEAINANNRIKLRDKVERRYARDAAEGNAWHRGVGMCGPWVKGGR